jgi:hypothetical protein|tara:strand:+ start:817 stop:1227 length:411 start_codon:yes stop_codon:yes gene_type:complete
VDISGNPISPAGAQCILKILLTNNDTLQSLGNDIDLNPYMGVRKREEIKQTLHLNQSNHERKRAILMQIEDTKKRATSEKNMDSLVDPLRKDQPLSQDKALTMDSQMSYPLLKPIVFTNELDDDYMYQGVWSMKKD